MTDSTSTISATEPLVLGAPEAFADVRALLARSQYDETTVARRLGGTTLYGVPRLADGRKTLAGEITDANGALIRLFLDGGALPETKLRGWFGPTSLGALDALGLLTPASDDGMREGTVLLYPTQGLWIVSDRQPTAWADISTLRSDYVFSAINELTRDFLALIPDVPGARFVELCSGTGIAALRALRRGAAEAWATDIAPRCVHFARFNAHLNDLADRATIIESDGWKALEGERFDVVAAHPPYVPALDHRFDFRDAGADGEHVTRHIITELPRHLRPGGRGIVRAAISDRRSAPIAARIREWLGSAGAAFDCVVVETGQTTPLEMYRVATKGGDGFTDLERWMRMFAANEIERFAVCAVEMRDQRDRSTGVTERRVSGGTLNAAAVDWQFRWAVRAATAGASPLERLAGQRPRVAPGVRLAVHLAADAESAWHTVGAAAETVWPTHGLVKAPPLAPTLLELCDGTRDAQEIHTALGEAGLIDDAVSVADVAHLLEVFAAAAIVALDNCPLPPSPATMPTA